MSFTEQIVVARDLYQTRLKAIERENKRWKVEIERNCSADPGLRESQLELVEDLRVWSNQIAYEQFGKDLDKLVSSHLQSIKHEKASE